MIPLKDYVCTIPFTHFQIHKDENWVCCPHWLTKEIPATNSLKNDWNSNEIIDIRKSVIDGSYKYCNSHSCPYLGELVNYGKGKVGPILHKSKLPEKIKKYYTNQTGKIDEGPENVQLNFDLTCNYKCPSCRNDMIVSDTPTIKEIQRKINEIENVFSDDIEDLYTSTVGDPFASVPIRNYLRNFDRSKYKKLKTIHLHTNASLWDKEMWESMSNIHKFVESCEISIDAGTEDTYENKTRLGGKWERLINNLKFISTIDTIKHIKCSFVVQKDNYNEMVDFVELINNIFNGKSLIFFCRLQNWNSYTKEEYINQEIHNVNHPEHNNFVNELNKVCFLPNVSHNLHEFVNLKQSLI